MPIPSLMLGILIASLYGALYHLWRGGGPKHIFFYLLLAWPGFFCGHFLSAWLGRSLLPIGSLNLGFGMLGALIFLFVGGWLSMLEVKD